MKSSDVLFVVLAAGVTIGAALWYMRRAQAANGSSSAPVGFSWNEQLRAYTKVNADGELERYAQGVYL